MIPLRDANPTRRLPVVTIGLIAACVAVFVYELSVQATAGDIGLARLFRDYGLVPAALTSQLAGGPGDGLVRAIFTVFSSMFLHGDLLHIGFNMLYLWIFGNNIEDRLGRPAFLAFYLAGGVLAAGAQVAIDPGSTVPVIGASGAIAAVLGAYLVLYPRARVQSLVFLGFFYQLLEVPAVIILGIWFVIQVVSGVASLDPSSASGGIALFAHIGGFLGGVAVGLLVRGIGPSGRPRSVRSSDRVGVG